MPRRELTFLDYADVIAEIDRLASRGYERTGQWTLGQVCRHLSYYMRGSLEGYPFRLPWIIRKLIGGRLLRKLLSDAPMPSGKPTVPASRPPDHVPEERAVAEARELLERLRAHTGPVHPSPIFGTLTPEQARALHLKHAAHHLGFLVPKETGGG
jgi:hypothetical protein